MDLDFLVNKISAFVLANSLNTVTELALPNIYDLPVVGVAAAQDPLWQILKQPHVVGPEHLLPEEWLPGAKSVIAYFLPFSVNIRKANRLQGQPAREWLYGRYEGEIFNIGLRKYIVELVCAAGFRAIAPVSDCRFKVSSFRSNWSERHAAFIAGLGTFSLSKSLISERGSAGRVGAIVTDLDLEPTKRPYQDYDEYCTKCGACMKRCPAESISEAGKNNKSCSEFLDYTKLRYRPRYGCGKCQTAVPCESRIPSKI